MNYFSQKHTQFIIFCFITTSLLLIAFAEIDILISNLFYYDGFYQKNAWWENLLYSSVPYFIGFSMLGMTGLWLTNRFLKKNLLDINGRKALYVTLVLIVGSGLIVNTIFKENFGRPRPRDIVEFNGSKQFQPIFAVSKQCSTNCSFSSGHGSAAFLAIALALLFKHRKLALLVALTYGTLVSFSRIVSGAHFFSDNVISFFVMLITADALYYYFFLNTKDPTQEPRRPD